MQALQLLTAQAIVGTERQTPTMPPAPGAIGETLAALELSDPAAGLLRAAGVLSVCQLAGHRLAPSTLSARPPCPPELLPHATDASLAHLFEAIIEHGPPRLQTEALRRLSGACLPHRVLPQALDLGRRTRAFRPYLLPVLGQRGLWLARLNPEWAYAAGAADDDSPEGAWETGSLDQRLIYLRQLRTAEPAQARDLLAQTLPETGAKERAALTAVLAINLGANDEDLLEGLLQKDRGKEVRLSAAALLARLPGSRYVARMAGRVEACFTSERKLLKESLNKSFDKLRTNGKKLIPFVVSLSNHERNQLNQRLLKQVLKLDAPETFAPDWKADGLEEAKPAYEKLGPRAWWLYQLTRALPLSWWTVRTGLSADQLLSWAKQGEWQEALWRGWLEMQTQTADPAWAKAFLSHLPSQPFPVDLFSLVLTLPPEDREGYWLKILQGNPPPAGLGGLLRAFLTALPDYAAPFSAEFSRQVFERVADYLRHAQTLQDYYLRETLTEFACLIPPEVFEDAEALWAAIPDAVPSYGVAGGRFADNLELRKHLHSHPLLTRD